MAVYSIVKIGDPILRERAQEIKKVTPNVVKLLENMAETMYETRGVGLAAPQIGIPKRAIVVDVGDGLVEIINPGITESSDETAVDVEGCLSVPNSQGEVERSLAVTVTGTGKNGCPIEIQAEGLMARVLQHEIDHLNGILFIDRALRLVDHRG